MTPVSPFLYRLPRFSIHFPFPVQCVVKDRGIAGQCLNLSETGLLAEFTVPLAVGTSGVAHLQPGGYVVEIPCSVTHTEGFRSGLLFAFSSREQEHLLRALVQAVAVAPTSRA